jgi:hypothetical protein
MSKEGFGGGPFDPIPKREVFLDRNARKDMGTGSTFARELFAQMSPTDKADFLRKQRQKGNTSEQLMDLYGTSPGNMGKDARRANFGETDMVGVSNPEVETEVVDDSITKENTLTTYFEVVEYPLERKQQLTLPNEINTLLQNECEVADILGKQYLQVAFANGTRVFEIRKKRGFPGKHSNYFLTPVQRPDVVDDFAE